MGKSGIVLGPWSVAHDQETMTFIKLIHRQFHDKELLIQCGTDCGWLAS